LALKNANQSEKSRRLRERFQLALPARIQCRESVDHEWTSMSRLVDVTPFGARLRLKRPTEIGRLLLLIVAMPRPLRCFDHAEDQYRVWSLVRNLRLLDPKIENGAIVEIGVAFVGKRPPKSFEDDPSRRYEIAESATDAGLWSVKEESDQLLSEVSIGEKRHVSRYVIPVEVLIEVFDKAGELSQCENTVTENISPEGAAVFTTLQLSSGRFVKLTSERQGVSMLAVVRGRRTGEDNIQRLHLEFIGGDWPL
jgi:hypothetical protein